MLIAISEVASGQKLSEDVMLPNGTTLLRSATILNDKLIETIEKHNITQIQVVSESMQETNNTTSEKPSEEIKEQINTANNAKSHEDTKAPAPIVRIDIENNGMSAYMRIEPSEDEGCLLTMKHLNASLDEKKIIMGIDIELLEKTVVDYNKSKRIIEIQNVAVGIKPAPSKETDIEFSIKHIISAKDLDTVKNCKYCWEITGSTIPIQQTNPGMIIAKKGLTIPYVSGKNILGDDIDTKEIEEKNININDNVKFDEAAGLYKALTTGLTYFIDNTLGVVPFNFDGSAELSINSDNMKAELTIHPAYEQGKHPTEKAIKKVFAENHVSFGIDTELLTKIISDINKGIYPDDILTIAEGLHPKAGNNGKIEYLFPTETSLKPKEDASGIVDYKDVSIIQTVDKNQELAKNIPPTAGTPGKDLSGRDLPCRAGSPINLPIGENTGPKPDDANILIALSDGNVKLVGNSVLIQEGFIINGDVDYSTGNVEYEKSVTIKGDVKSSFNITCGGDLDIGGTIEDCEIDVGGSLLCKYGFVGQGKGNIECKGDVNVGFIKNQKIRTRGNVNIAKEALNSTILSRKNIVVHGKHLSIAGGSLIARDSIECNVIGNTSGIRTNLEVGLDFTLIIEMEKTEKLMSEVIENKRKLMASYEKFDRLMKIKKKLPPKEEFLYTKLKNTITKYDTQIKALEDRKELINKKKYSFDNSFVKINHSALTGTIIKIGERHLIVHEEIIGPKTIRMVNFEIRIL